MALYEMTIVGTLYDQQVVNRFHYASPIVGTIVNGAQDLANTVVGGLLADIAAIQTTVNSIAYEKVVTRDLYDPTEFGEVLLPGIFGTDAGGGDAAPPFLALAFRSPRMLTGKNRAYKRFAGIGEARILGNQFSFPGTLIADLEAGLVAEVVGAFATYDPWILYLEKTPGTPPTYALYPNETDQRAHALEIAQMDAYRLTTQRSRIEGHGV